MAISAITGGAAYFPGSATGIPRGQGASQGSAGAGQLTPEEQAQVDKLKARDRQVRQHEQAHMAAGAGLVTSGASFTYQRGPDGVNYAIGGEVGINTLPGRTPDETIRRAQQIRAAALAPADPSGQDRAVAAQAAQMEIEARLAQSAQPAGEPGGRSVASMQDRIAKAYGIEAGGSSLNAYA